MALLNFDASQVDPQQNFTPVPAGWYNVMIVGSETKENSAKNGSYLQLTVKVIDGQHAGRQVFDTLNLEHPNPVAVEIAYKRLSSYCHAVGQIRVQDSAQLHGVPFKVRLGIKVDKTGQYDDSNDIKAVANINEATGAQQAPVQPSFGSQPTAGFGSQPQQGFAQPAFAQPAPVVPAVTQPAQIQPVQAAPAPAPVQQQQAPVQQPAPAVAGATPPWAKRKVG